jgi:SAM-dependent methyltransferase
MRATLQKLIGKWRGRPTANPADERIKYYLLNGREPWSHGYLDYRNQVIAQSLADTELLKSFADHTLPQGFGLGLDERLVEYCWIFTRLSGKSGRLLDAGSTFNYEFVLDQALIKSFELFIQTYYPEEKHFTDRRISYLFGDLRQMLFRDSSFDLVVCQSTLEHIDMDMSVYGYQLERKAALDAPSFSYLEAVRECVRVLKPGGILLVTVPYGRWEDHGFFQQFDQQMIEAVLLLLKPVGQVDIDYFQYSTAGWQWSSAELSGDCISFNPHTGKGKGSDGAAHSRAIACVCFQKQH